LEELGALAARAAHPLQQRQRARLKDRSQLGDIERVEYLAGRDRLRRERAAVAAGQMEEQAELDRLAAPHRDVKRGWEVVRQERRYQLTRLSVEEVARDDDRVAAVKPRPELAGFFAQDCQSRVCTGGSDGDRFRESHTPDEAASIRSSFPLVLRRTRRPTRPLRERRAGSPQHKPELPRALWPRVAESARAFGLRQAAKDYGISHEAVRRILREI
jgi:hypothetical protein